ncbi:hypothetical protein DEU56DRAFT_773745 [Suillus clintonianus]|uniref:uncharacterized protein n=1 Tax=Suillus clintonianus TaxID=1904413 RepID=UPI001B872238|nr:uncharacterized protein DEU56DRAFT_773745 [Suillus clintonianus]KAG2153214.1 hypothetical protein DEU56DRAFT_773745 [Suillus clintonianus]
MLRVTMRMRRSKMMLRRMKLKPRTLTCLVCCLIAKVDAAGVKAMRVAGGRITIVGDAEEEAEAGARARRLRIKFAQVGE